MDNTSSSSDESFSDAGGIMGNKGKNLQDLVLRNVESSKIDTYYNCRTETQEKEGMDSRVAELEVLEKYLHEKVHVLMSENDVTEEYMKNLQDGLRETTLEVTEVRETLKTKNGTPFKKVVIADENFSIRMTLWRNEILQFEKRIVLGGVYELSNFSMDKYPLNSDNEVPSSKRYKSSLIISN